MQTLIEDVQKLQSTLNQLRESSARQLSHFEEELQVRSRHIQRLEAQLEAQKDYKEIRRELRYCTIALVLLWRENLTRSFTLIRPSSSMRCRINRIDRIVSMSAEAFAKLLFFSRLVTLYCI